MIFQEDSSIVGIGLGILTALKETSKKISAVEKTYHLKWKQSIKY